jgi:hypothetical protein
LINFLLHLLAEEKIKIQKIRKFATKTLKNTNQRLVIEEKKMSKISSHRPFKSPLCRKNTETSGGVEWSRKREAARTVEGLGSHKSDHACLTVSGVGSF